MGKHDLQESWESYLDEDMMQGLREMLYEDGKELFSMALRGGMLGAFLKDGLPLHFVSEQLLKELKLTRTQFWDLCDGDLIETVHPDERETYLMTVKEGFEAGDAFDIICRVKVDQKYHYMRDIGKKTRLEGQDEMLLILRSDVTSLFQQQKTLEEQAEVYAVRNRELEDLNRNLPGGICRVAADEHFTLYYGNDGFFQLTGYTRDQFKTEKLNQIEQLIYEKDLEYVKRTIGEMIAQEEREVEMEHRIVQKDGTMVWLLMKGHFSYEEEHPILSCSVMDITVQKKAQEEAKISKERFRVALAQTDNTLFEYNIQTRVMIHADRSAEAYGLNQHTENVPESLLEMGVVSPDSGEDFLSMYRKISSGSRKASCLIKVRLKSGLYAWRKILMTAIFDDSGTPVQAVGVVEDVDEQVKREESLRYQVERDPLTGLYNRGAVVSRIEWELRHRTQEKYQAMIIIDIDDFKVVNDSNGHMFGDYVLKESARRISMLIRKDETIGRIGGDEFVAYISELPTEEAAVACAQRIVDTFSSKFCERGIEAQVSCSVGLAICPCHGLTFEVLYQNADIALYVAKKSGKNTLSKFHTDLISHN